MPWTSPACSPSAARWRACSALSRTGPASATWRPTSPMSTTTAASRCSRPAPGWGSRSPTSSPPWCGRARTASAPSSPPTRSTCRSSWLARTCRCWPARSRPGSIRRPSRCSRAGGTTYAWHGWSRRAPGRTRYSRPTARPSWRRSPPGPGAPPTAVSPISPTSPRPTCGTPSPPSRTCAHGSPARTLSAASSSRRAAALGPGGAGLRAATRDLAPQRRRDALRTARRAADELFAILARRLEEATAGQLGGPVLRLTDDFAADPVWGQGLAVTLENLLVAFSELRDGVESIADRLALDDPAERKAQLIGELRGVVRRLEAAAQGLTAGLPPPPGPAGGGGGGAAVRWIERRGRRHANLSLASVPLDLAPILKSALFDRVETVVLTSATIAAGREFTFLEQRLGLDLEPSRVMVREILPSPFDFAAQCLFGIPTDLPEPRDDEPGHDAAVARVLLELGHAAAGGGFCLFSSHGALPRAAGAVRGRIGGGGAPRGSGGGGERPLL